jgi:hypothetical protein
MHCSGCDCPFATIFRDMTFFFPNEVFHHPNYYFPSSWSLICSRQFQIVSGLALLVAKTHLCRRGKDPSSIIARTVPSIWAWSHSLLSNNPSRFLPLPPCECVHLILCFELCHTTTLVSSSGHKPVINPMPSESFSPSSLQCSFPRNNFETNVPQLGRTHAPTWLSYTRHSTAK